MKADKGNDLSQCDLADRSDSEEKGPDPSKRSGAQLISIVPVAVLQSRTRVKDTKSG